LFLSGFGKEVAIGASCAVTSFVSNCDAAVYSPSAESITGSFYDLGYACSTAPGTSGSPVISLDTMQVVGLHRCSSDCPQKGVPVSFLWPQLAPFLSQACLSPEDCPSAPPCHQPACEQGVCVYPRASCDDGDPCTLDSCLHPAAPSIELPTEVVHAVGYGTDVVCLHRPLADCAQGAESPSHYLRSRAPSPSACATALDCPVEDPCLEGVCDSSGQCVFVSSAQCCHTSADCAIARTETRSSCSHPVCLQASHRCVALPVPFACYDGDPCTEDVCHPVVGCRHPPVCTAPDDACHVALCVPIKEGEVSVKEGGEGIEAARCEVRLVPGCCTADAECAHQPGSVCVANQCVGLGPACEGPGCSPDQLESAARTGSGDSSHGPAASRHHRCGDGECAGHRTVEGSGEDCHSCPEDCPSHLSSTGAVAPQTTEAVCGNSVCELPWESCLSCPEVSLSEERKM
jgi:hypothetical protein